MEEIRLRYEQIIQEYNRNQDLNKKYDMMKSLAEEVDLRYREIDKYSKAEFYSIFSFVCFEKGLYCDFFKYLLKAQRNGYAVDSIKEILYETFLRENEQVFRSNYQKNISEICFVTNEFSIPLFEELKYYTLPTEQESIFCLMDKKTGELKKMIDIRMNNPVDITLQNVFSDLVFGRGVEYLGGHALYCHKTYKKCYYIADDLERFLSYLQASVVNPNILNSLVVVDSIETLGRYIEKNNLYIPWNIVASHKDKKYFEEMFTQIREKRIREKINKKPLLSICIPSFNRGDLALKHVKEILMMNFDYEVEVILSNNGSDNETVESYEILKNLKDQRFRYHEFMTNRGYLENSCKVADMAKGDFFILLSDEDSIYEEGLFKLLQLIEHQGESLSIIKTSHVIQGRVKAGYAKAGIDAYRQYMLSSNYLSINIYKKELIKEYIYYPFEHIDNKACFYYSHMCWELFAMQYGDVLSTDILFVCEGEARQTVNTEKKEIRASVNINKYQTIESRIEQHQGFMEIINELEICQGREDIKRELYRKLCLKTFFLADISIKAFYGEDARIKKMDFVRTSCKKILEDTLNDIDLKTKNEELSFIDSIYDYVNEN